MELLGARAWSGASTFHPSPATRFELDGVEGAGALTTAAADGGGSVLAVAAGFSQAVASSATHVTIVAAFMPRVVDVRLGKDQRGWYCPRVRALTLDDRGLGLRDVPVPKRAGGEALIRVRMAGVCRTDVELARGYMQFSGTLGHELLGNVVEADDRKLVGARVAGEINLACGRCDLCARGWPRHCRERSVLGILGKDGCFAEYVTLPERNLHRVPDGVSDEAACFIEPVAACHEIFEQVPLLASDRIVVLGDGKLGQLVALVLRARGMQPMLIGRHEPKLSRARAAGVAVADADSLRDKSIDVVVEATGSPSGMQLALRLLRPRGTLVLKSTYHGQLTLDAAPLVIDELTLVGSRCGPFEPAITSLATATVDPTPLIDATFPLSEAMAAFERASTPGVMKVLLDMRAQ
jgi:threonine dehydrogenase-like Zn-dependent dehydrogenase